MMIESLSAIVTAFLALVSVVFLVYRFGFFSGEGVSGRYAFLFGGILVFIATAWQTVKSMTEYGEWFVEGAYPIIDLVQLSLFVLGILLAVSGLALYADFWQTRREELATRDRQLSILGNLQADAREPYQTVEFLDLAIREIISHFPDMGGAIFFVNRSQRQLVLTASVGFTKQETAFLERYPYGQNVISQSVESTEPMISGSFDFVDASGKTIVSRFNSSLVLPLVSGREKIGAIVLVSPVSRFFGRTEIRYLSPVADWLAEMVKSSRLAKELTSTKRELENYTSQYSDFTRRVVRSADSFSRADILPSFCGSLVGLVSCRSVHLLGMKNGALSIYGGSEPVTEFSENYRTALIDALDKKKPLIINQEAAGDDGRTYIARSTLLYPVGSETEGAALMFIKDGSPFRVSEGELKEIDVYARLALLALRQKDIHRLDITRKKGLDKVVQFLRFDPGLRFDGDPGFFMRHLAAVMPTSSIAITFVKQNDGSFRAVDGLHANAEQLASLITLPGEGCVGSVAVDYQAQFVSGKTKVNQEVRAFDQVNRDAIQKLFGEPGLPNFMAACPISGIDDILGVVLIFMFDLTENEQVEWQRLLTLAAGLISLRLTINELHAAQPVLQAPEFDEQRVGESMNRLNNYLSAIVGNAGLAQTREDLSGEVRNHFKSIIREAEQASLFMKNAFGGYLGDTAPAPTELPPSDTVNDIVQNVLMRNRISDNLYMIGGRAREISLTLSDIDQTEFPRETIQGLFEEAMNRFASLADQEDIITVATYAADNYVYLDISRHHRNFPPVQNVARFGHYQRSGEVLRYRPADTFLKHLGDKDCYYAFDRVAQEPSYLSFKFPARIAGRPPIPQRGAPRILAIDDQAVILDLISAMCQATGYNVKTAVSAEEGLQLALNEKFDIVLTDLAMPGLSGLEIAREVRKKRPDVPIVLVTGWEVNISKEKMDAAGITRVLYKPFRIEQLTDLIGTLLEARSLT